MRRSKYAFLFTIAFFKIYFNGNIATKLPKNCRKTLPKSKKALLKLQFRFLRMHWMNRQELTERDFPSAADELFKGSLIKGCFRGPPFPYSILKYWGEIRLNLWILMRISIADRYFLAPILRKQRIRRAETDSLTAQVRHLSYKGSPS